MRRIFRRMGDDSQFTSMQLTLAIFRRTARKPATVQVRLFGSDRKTGVTEAYRALYEELIRAFSVAAESCDVAGPAKAPARHRPCHARIVFHLHRNAKRPWGFRAETDSEATVAECNTIHHISTLLAEKSLFYAE